MNRVLQEHVFPAGESLQLVEGDLTQEDVNVIVNAANAQLQHGGGVAGAIVHHGGKEIQGIFGYSKERAAGVIFNSFNNYFEKEAHSGLKLIRLTSFDQPTIATFLRVWNSIDFYSAV